jgi:hypothetical protein
VRRTPLVAPLFAASLALAQSTYHVAPPAAGGDDSNTGTEKQPWATLQHAANNVSAGDTVIVHAGTYAGFNVGESGAPGAPISFIAQPGVLVNTEAVRFNGQTHRARINMDTVSHIVIDGFEVAGTNDQRNSKAGIRMVAPPGSTEDESGFIVVRNCHVHHNGEWGIFSGHVHRITVENNNVHDQYDEHGVYLSNSADNHVVRGNRIWNNSSQGFHCNSDASQGGDGVTTGVLVENNIIWGNAVGSVYIDAGGVERTSIGGGSAINFDGVRDSVIRNNVLYDNHASGISLYRIDGLLPASNNLVVNNTIINGSGANPTTRWCLNISDASTGNIVFNNIMLNYHSFRGSIIISPDSLPGFISDHNVVMDRLDPTGDGTPLTLAQWQTATGQDAHSLAVPRGAWAGLFVDLPAWDLHLAPGSAAADAGAPMIGGRSAPTVDADGVGRPQGGELDIGAYERAGGQCGADFNDDGVATSQDFFDFLDAFFGADPRADFNEDGGVNSQDFFDFLAAFFAGC